MFFLVDDGVVIYGEREGLGEYVYCDRGVKIDDVQADEWVRGFARNVLEPIFILPLIYSRGCHHIVVDTLENFLAYYSDFRFSWVYETGCRVVFKSSVYGLLG